MSIYNIRPNLMIGFHGCDAKVRDALVNTPDTIKISEKKFDWLGHGFYVWENNYERALLWAEEKKKRNSSSPNFEPSVVGVVYTLDYCLDFTDSHFITLLATYHSLFINAMQIAGSPLPTNKDLVANSHKDLVLRELDCAVIQYMHKIIEEEIKENILKSGFSNLKRFDTIRGIFTEGGPAYNGAGIQSKNHIQVCLRNLNCIKGFFIPRKSVDF